MYKHVQMTLPSSCRNKYFKVSSEKSSTRLINSSGSKNGSFDFCEAQLQRRMAYHRAASMVHSRCANSQSQTSATCKVCMKFRVSSGCLGFEGSNEPNESNENEIPVSSLESIRTCGIVLHKCKGRQCQGTLVCMLVCPQTSSEFRKEALSLCGRKLTTCAGPSFDRFGAWLSSELAPTKSSTPGHFAKLPHCMSIVGCQIIGTGNSFKAHAATRETNFQSSDVGSQFDFLPPAPWINYLKPINYERFDEICTSLQPHDVSGRRMLCMDPTSSAKPC